MARFRGPLSAGTPDARYGGTAGLIAVAFGCALIGWSVPAPARWIAIGATLAGAALVWMGVVQMRVRGREAAERRQEADLAVEMARILLRGGDLSGDVTVAGARLAQVLGLPWVAIRLEPVDGDERQVALALRKENRRLGTLLVPAGTSAAGLRRMRMRVVPALEELLSAALERDALQGEVVETVALRRADVVKTAVLRAVSHDLRSPLTAISTAGEALALEGLSAQGHRELAAVIVEETRRLTRLVENVLDVSRLEAGAARPRLEWTSVDEVIRVAIAELSPRGDEFDLSIDRSLPLIRADSAQLERAFVNVLENARRHSGGQPVSIRARFVGQATAATGLTGRVIVRIVDRGPGIAPADLDRVFEPFYRGGVGGEHRGSGLGLAIARGFAEANGGSLEVESLPGQGATFVFELPLEPGRTTNGHGLFDNTGSSPMEHAEEAILP
jgi:two-component system sensor histidine kinase KdpD